MSLTPDKLEMSKPNCNLCELWEISDGLRKTTKCLPANVNNKQ